MGFFLFIWFALIIIFIILAIYKGRLAAETTKTSSSLSTFNAHSHSTDAMTKRAYSFKIYIWMPSSHIIAISKKASGHAAVSIAGYYFSFSKEEKNTWSETLESDISYHEENLSVRNQRIEIELPVSQCLYSHVLDQYNPDYGYRGMNGYGYRLRLTNCCFIVAAFIESALLAYLIELFGYSNESTYWLNRGDKEAKYWGTQDLLPADIHRYEVLKKLYYKYNEKNPSKTVFDIGTRYSDEEALLTRWTLFKLYYAALVHEKGPNQTRSILKKLYSRLRPDDILWHPLRLQRYANFAKAVMEKVGNQNIHVPYIYETAWDRYGYPKAEKRRVPTVEEFVRIDLPEQPVSEKKLRF
jgi:hypothetical protein